MPERPAAPHRFRRWVAVAAAGLVVAVGAVAAGSRYVVAVTRARIVASAELVPTVPDAMILGNRVFDDGTPCAELAARLGTGLRLYQLGRTRRLIVSGLRRAGYDEPGAMAAWLEARGVPAAAIVLDPGGYRTAASMADAAAGGVHSLLVVSQAYHLPRALYLAAHAGIDAVGIPAVGARRTPLDRAHEYVRERLARAETILEVALRGVRGHPDQKLLAPGR